MENTFITIATFNYSSEAHIIKGKLESEGIKWSRKILEHSPTAIRFLKNSFIAESDGLAGLQNMAGDITMMYYMTEEAKEGKNSFNEKRKPDFSKFPKPPFHG